MVRDFADKITWIAVADGKRAVILRNDGANLRPSLSLVDVATLDNPPTRDQGVDRPGRGNDGRGNDGRAGSARKSAFEETDFHRVAKQHFARDFAARLNMAATAGAFDRLVVIAPPETLGALRAHYHADLEKRVIREIDRDLTGHKIADIERHVAEVMARR